MATTTSTTGRIVEATKSKQPPSSEILYLRHSKARVLVRSTKHFIIGYESNGLPKFSREMQDVDVIAIAAKYWSKH